MINISACWPKVVRTVFLLAEEWIDESAGRRLFNIVVKYIPSVSMQDHTHSWNKISFLAKFGHATLNVNRTTRTKCWRLKFGGFVYINHYNTSFTYKKKVSDPFFVAIDVPGS
jgi:hypothetical protein